MPPRQARRARRARRQREGPEPAAEPPPPPRRMGVVNPDDVPGEGDEREEEIIRQITTPGGPATFSGPQTVARHFGISTKKATEILRKLDSYTLHKQTTKAKPSNPYFFHGRGTFQLDLVVVEALAAANDGIKFLLLIIEEFTRLLWVYPCKTKSAPEIYRHFEHWLTSIQDTPARARRIFHDGEKAFLSGRVRELLRQHDVMQRVVTGNSPGLIERVNKSFQAGDGTLSISLSPSPLVFVTTLTGCFSLFFFFAVASVQISHSTGNNTLSGNLK